MIFLKTGFLMYVSIYKTTTNNTYVPTKVRKITEYFYTVYQCFFHKFKKFYRKCLAQQFTSKTIVDKNQFKLWQVMLKGIHISIY